MDIAAIEISKDEARERLAEYTGMLAAERTAEDDAIAAGYRAAARGLPVISLSRTIAAGGWHEDGLPKIAIINAYDPEVSPPFTPTCYARWHNGGLVFADRDDQHANRGSLVGAHSVRVPIPGDDRPPGPLRRVAGSAVVPLIPPRHRPRPHRLRHCHILWEVPSWTRIPPEDPALLRHIRGDLWAVLAVWDLTELERLVLSQR